jgi:hypothetical protein
MTTNKLDQLFLQFEAVTESLAPLEAERDRIKADIKTALEEVKLDSYSAGKVSATRIESTRVTYDSKKLEEIFKPEELAPAKRETTFTSLRVSLAKEKKNENEA